MWACSLGFSAARALPGRAAARPLRLDLRIVPLSARASSASRRFASQPQPAQPLEKEPDVPWTSAMIKEYGAMTLAFATWYVILERARRYKLLWLLLGGGLVLLPSLSETRHEDQTILGTGTIVELFETGHVPFAFDINDAGANSIDRPELHARLQTFLRPERTKSYGVIGGAQGAGKSTATRKAVRDGPKGRPNGAVYFDAQDGLDFSKRLGDTLLSQSRPSNVWEALRRKLMKKEIATTVVTWQQVAASLSASALAYRIKHNRPMTLLIDNTQELLRQDPAFLTILQKYAKAEADTGHLRIVFVSSDPAVHQAMKKQSDWSRAAYMEVGEGDVSEAQAVRYLLQRNGWDARDELKQALAEHIVRNISGTRLSLLNEVESKGINSMDEAKAWEKILHDRTKRSLEDCGVSKGHHLLDLMLDAPGQLIIYMQLRHEACLKGEQINALVKANVLVAHMDDTYTCAARHVVAAFEALRAKDGAVRELSE